MKPRTPAAAAPAPAQPSESAAQHAAPARPDFVKMEKNLASLGFFTPSNKRTKGTKKKVVTTTREVDGRKVEGRATILPSAEYGLPITADQDTYLAILKLAMDMKRFRGKVENPVTFTTAELLRVQGKNPTSGFHYKELQEQLLRIKTASILSEGAVYFAGRKTWAKDAFNVVDRVVLFGMQLEDGTTADRHYVWLSEWQIENINNNFLLPIDYDTYRQLKNHISKALVPLLQIWLYASRNERIFEKRYSELCQILNIREYAHASKITEKLGPSLNELREFGYLESWRLDRMTNGSGYKVVLVHGEKFFRDQQRKLPEPPPAPAPAAATLEQELVQRGIGLERARKLIQECGPNQPVLDQLEWGDHILAQSPAGTFYNPPGFYVHLLKENVTPPENFITSRKRHLLERVEKTSDDHYFERQSRELEYEEYRRRAIEEHLADAENRKRFDELVETKRGELASQYKSVSLWSAESVEEIAVAAARSELGRRLRLPSCAEYLERPSE